MTYDELIEQAEKHYNAHEYQRAIDCATRAIALDVTKSDGYFWRGISYVALYDTENVMKDAETLLTLVPCTTLHRGFAYNVKGNYKEAVDACTKALQEDANAIMVYRCRAWAYLNEKDYTSAIADYNKIIEIVPQSAFAYGGLGDVYLDQKKFDIAIENYTKAIGIDEKDPNAYNNRGVAYFDIRNFNQAKEDFTNAIENNEKNAFAHFNRGNCFYNTDDFVSAIADYSKSIEIDPKNVLVYRNRGLSFYATGDFYFAIKDYDKSIEIDPNNADAYIDRGESYLMTGEFASAIADFNKVLEIDPNNAFAYLYRGYSLSRTRNFVSAIADFNKVLEIDPNNAFAYYERGRVYFQQKDYSLKAMKAYAEALEFFPDKEFSIAGFLKSIEHNGNDINNEVKKQFQESSNDLVNFVGEVLLTIKEWNDCHKYIRLIREVYNLLEQLEKEIDKEKANGIFYQYVKENSFAKEIGETRVLWLTPACYQNDPDEGKYIFKFFHSQFKTEPLTNLFKELIDGENTDIGYPIAFIRSFSECKDDLLMWDSSYGGNGAGVSLGVPFCKLAKAMKRPEHRELKNIDESAMLTSMLDEGNQVSFVTSQNQYSKVEKDDMTALSMEQLYFIRVLYLSPDEETEEHKKYEVHLKGIKNVLEEFTDEYLKNTDNAQHFKNFLPRIFLPIAHLIKSADYKHEKEWRLLYYTPIKKERPFIKRGPLRIETESILFKDKEEEEIWLGPNIGQYPELERMKILHLFEYEGIADCVDIKTSKKHFRG